MDDFIKEAGELMKQYNELGKKIMKLYSDNWDKLVGRYFYYPSKETYIKFTGFSKAMFGEQKLMFTYCKKKYDTYDQNKYEYTTKSDYFLKGGIPKNLVEVTEDEFVKHMAEFFNEAANHVMTYVEGKKGE